MLHLDVNVTRNVVILGSTGSIGQQALDVVRANPDHLKVVGLAAGRRTDLLSAQVAEFGCRYVSAPSIQPGRKVSGASAVSLTDICQVSETDCVLISTVGATGLLPTLAAIKAGKTIALANKEVLVMAGEMIMGEAHARRVPILPVDSEHSAVWQCLDGDCFVGPGITDDTVERIILTASGGAFRDHSIDQLLTVTREEALAHPNWVMGPKVTIDSATLMNKGFEVIEAHWLFGIPYERIDVVMHRESIVHALVEFIDGTMKAELGPPDMRLPVQHALTYPERRPGSWPRLRLESVGQLSFSPLERNRYPCFNLALEAAQAGGSIPTVLSAADDVAVKLFLDGKISFTEIPNLIDRALQTHERVTAPTVEEILAIDEQTRRLVDSWVNRGTRRA